MRTRWGLDITAGVLLDSEKRQSNSISPSVSMSILIPILNSFVSD